MSKKSPAGWLNRLFGAAPAKPPAKKPGVPATVADSPRARLIAEARRIHRAQGAALRRGIDQAIADLEKAGPKILRDPAAMTRLLELVRARRAMARLMGHDLRRYVVVSAMRSLLDPGPAEGGDPPPPKRRVVRR